MDGWKNLKREESNLELRSQTGVIARSAEKNEGDVAISVPEKAATFTTEITEDTEKNQDREKPVPIWPVT